jgi:ABC-type multidrug transport system ATPase subunit
LDRYDILWENLTGEEHLLFYGRLRNLSGKKLKRHVAEVLKKVNLYRKRKVLAGNYSGGMKRRLSVAIAIINNPPVIFLDEPSTVF